jgi:HEPN domain.
VVDGLQDINKVEQSIEARINSFALVAFRDVADFDYIAARLAYKANLYPQFMWSGLQAVEKYLKGILLLNRVSLPKEKIGHNISSALSLVNSNCKFKIKLHKESKEVFDTLCKFGKYRYAEVSWYILGHDLQKLDMLVWDIRRYCQILDYSIRTSHDQKISFFDAELKRVEHAENDHPYRFKIMGGKLESIMSSRDSDARRALLWNNPCFGTRLRYRITATCHSVSQNTPLTVLEEYPLSVALSILDRLKKYIPSDLSDAYKKFLADKHSQKTNT